MSALAVPHDSSACRRWICLFLTGLAWGLLALPAAAQDIPLDGRFRYQGELRDGGVVVDGLVDFRLKIFDQPVAGNQVTVFDQVVLDVPVTRGVFEIDVQDIFSPFGGSRRYLEIEVRRPAGVGTYTLLTPRVELLPTPYAHHAITAGSAQAVDADSITSNSIQNGAVTSDDIDPGLLNLLINPTSLGGVPSSNYLRKDVNSSITATNWQFGSGSMVFGGLNLILFLGDTSADIVEVPGALNVDGNTVLGDGTSDTVTVAGAATVAMHLTVDGNTVLGSSPSSTTFMSGATAIATNLNVDGSTTLGDAAGDTTTIAGAATVATNLSVNGNTNLGDAAGDTTTIAGTATMNSADIAGAAFVGSFLDVGTSVQVGSSLNVDGAAVVDGSLTVGGSVFADRVVHMSQTEGDQTLYFYNNGSNTASRIMWEEALAVSCTPFGIINQFFMWEIDASANTGWVFRDGSDYEVFIDEGGNIVADGAVTPSSGCDVAESFFAEDDLAPGTVVAIAHGRLEVVEPSRIPYQRGLVGVVSSHPGVLLDGPSYDTLPLVREHKALAAQLDVTPEDEELVQRYVDVERSIDSAPRGNVPVALAGRVPVLTVGRVLAGQALTSSHVPGHAMALDRPGPSLGIALQDKTTDGPGEVLMLVQPGHAVPDLDATEDAASHDPVASVDELDARLLRLESLLAPEDGDGARGSDARVDPSAAARAAAVLAGRAPGGNDARPTDSAPGVVAVPGPAASPRTFVQEAWGDFDADGRDDVLVLDPAGESTLHRNLGGGHFLDVTANAGLSDLTDLRIAAWQDSDGDGRLDILLVNGWGVASLFKGLGTGRFEDATTALGLDFGRPIVSAEWIDHDRDGRPDLRVTMDDGRILLHHNLGQDAFRSIELRASTAATGDDRIAALEAQLAHLQAQLAALLAQKDGAR